MNHLVTSSPALAFLTNMSEECKFTLHSAVQVKNWRKAIGIEEQSGVISFKKVNELLTYTIMLDSFIVVYVLFVIMLIELKKLLSQELKCLCSKTTTVLLE
jgi:hypothetical protein